MKTITDEQLHTLQTDVQNMQALAADLQQQLKVIEGQVPPVIPPVIPPIKPPVTETPVLSIAQVSPNFDSIQITIDPVPGAVDYRAFDKDNPALYQCSAGALTIEWADLDKPMTLIIEAMSDFGLFMEEGNCLNGRRTTGSELDFKILARSAWLPVMPTLHNPATGSQQFFETWPDGSEPMVPVTPDVRIFPDHRQDAMAFGNSRWTDTFYYCNPKLSMDKVDRCQNTLCVADAPEVFWEPGHIFMGGTQYATAAKQPRHPLKITGNQVLHLRGEWDSHFLDYLWASVFFGRFGDALTDNVWASLSNCPLLSGDCVAANLTYQFVQASQFTQSAGPGTIVNGSITQRNLKGSSTTENWQECWRVEPVPPRIDQIGYKAKFSGNGDDSAAHIKHLWEFYLQPSSGLFFVTEQGEHRLSRTVGDKVFPGWLLPELPTWDTWQVWLCWHSYHSAKGYGDIRERYVVDEKLAKIQPGVFEVNVDNIALSVLETLPF